jgi:phosphatidylserine/phosphatidylglycerophosphate/cardiolipin synthase-like enzyme
MMMWLLLATGYTGALTCIFLVRWVSRHLGTIPSVGALFSPKGGCTDRVVQELQQARREVLVQAYSFTSKAITQALIEAKKRGAEVDILLDKSNELEPHTDLPILVEQGLTPLIDAKHAIAHNKIMIIDKRTLITGSFNFTRQAEIENAENVLVIKGHPELIAAYRQNFLAHKLHCVAPGQIAAHPQMKRAA